MVAMEELELLVCLEEMVEPEALVLQALEELTVSMVVMVVLV